jgi:hypothetical protein
MLRHGTHCHGWLGQPDELHAIYFASGSYAPLNRGLDVAVTLGVERYPYDRAVGWGNLPPDVTSGLQSAHRLPGAYGC